MHNYVKFKINIANKLPKYNLLKNIAILHLLIDFSINVISICKMDRLK